MAFRFNKRIKIGRGLGVNVSKSGITPSYRNKRGSLSSKGYSVRTGIPGLTYRKTFSKAKNSGCLILLFPFLLVAVFFSCENFENEKVDEIGTNGCRDINCSNYTSQASANQHTILTLSAEMI